MNLSVRRLAAIAAVAAISLSACGGDDSGGDAGEAESGDAGQAATNDDGEQDAADGDAAADDAAGDSADDAAESDTGEESGSGQGEAAEGGFGDIDMEALAELDFDANRCLEASGAALAVASAPMALMVDDPDVDYDDLMSEMDGLISDLPEEFHPELRRLADLVRESADYDIADPDNPLVSPEYEHIWDDFFVKLEAVCPSGSVE